MKRRIISLLMAALMSMTLLGTTAFALDTVDNESQGRRFELYSVIRECPANGCQLMPPMATPGPRTAIF